MHIYRGILNIGMALVAVGWALCILCMPHKALASFFPDHVMEMVREEVADTASMYDTIRAELEPIDPDEWTIEQHHTYLNAALRSIYAGLNYYFMENGSLPDDLPRLAGTEYIRDWPANPYNEWKPIEILDLEDGFVPGGVVLQICPPEFWSYIRNTRPVSCELSIFGPDIEYGKFGDAQPAKPNTWAVVPDGAVFMLGQHGEPVSRSIERREQDEEEGDES